MTLRIKGATTIKGLTTVGFGPPLTVSGLQIWLDASDASTITIATGVSQWQDKSGNGNHASQSTGSAQPTVQTAAQNGLNTLLFSSASSQMFSLSSSIALTSAGYTIFGVVKRLASGSLVLEAFGNSTDTVRAYLEIFSDNRVYSDGLVRQVISTAQSGSTSFNQITVTQNSANPSVGAVYFNGADITSSQATASGSPATIVINQVGRGDNSYTNGSIAELLIYNSVLSTNDRQKVEAYLKAKWATP